MAFPRRGEKWIGSAQVSTWTVTDPCTGDTWTGDGTYWDHCPISGLACPRSRAVWSRGRWIHPKAKDEPAYDEPTDRTFPTGELTITLSRPYLEF